MDASVSREAFRHRSIVYYWISMNRGADTRRTPARVTAFMQERDVGYPTTKRMCERKPRPRCRGHISHPYERENAEPRFLLPPRREWNVRDTHTRAGGGKSRGVTNPFSSQERRSVRFDSTFAHSPLIYRAYSRFCRKQCRAQWRLTTFPLTAGTMADKVTSRRCCRGSLFRTNSFISLSFFSPRLRNSFASAKSIGQITAKE